MSKRFTSSVHTGHTKIVESFLEETFGAFLTRKYEKSAKPRLKIRENILLVSWDITPYSKMHAKLDFRKKVKIVESSCTRHIVIGTKP
jgi:hypothetical protein